MTRALPVLTLLAAAGCVTGEWRASSTNEPLPQERIEKLRPGVDTLRECLDALGAPMTVREHARAVDGSSGMALTWVWSAASGFGIDLSSGDDNVPGSLSYDSDGIESPVCVLWFDEKLVLERLRIGTAGDLLPRRTRPVADVQQ